MSARVVSEHSEDALSRPFSMQTSLCLSNFRLDPQTGGTEQRGKAAAVMVVSS